MKSHVFLVALGLMVLTGCQSAGHKGTEHKMSFGPPPPGYVRIRGEALPNAKLARQSL